MIETDLPIGSVLPEIAASLVARTSLVLVAPPGAGKTTLVPLALLDAPWRGDGSILVLEPRRIAARAAALRMAVLLRETLGQRVGLRTRFESRISPATRIEVMTEGVFTRRIVHDPELTGVAAILFDEFHERSVDADIGLAFALECQAALRPDLRIIIMSATLDDQRIASLLGDAPVIRSEGRSFPIETRYRGRNPVRRLEDDMADAITAALFEESGSLLAFLPGQGEIIRVLERLNQRKLPDTVDITPLYGTLDPSQQDAAIHPAQQGRRKVVLATSIAETSLTIEGVRIVIDSGLQRVPRYEPDLGISRLETIRVNRASADQRRGRAGRTGSGIAIRLWDEAEDRGLIPFGTPEILESDLTSFRLDCAEWGIANPHDLTMLDAPPLPALREAERTLRALGALDGDDHITREGRALSRLPLSPRLAALVLEGARRGAASDAAGLAVLISERGIGGMETDLSIRLDRLAREKSPRANKAREMAARWAGMAGSKELTRSADPAPSAAALLALAYPDRLARQRGDGMFALGNGRIAMLDAADSLARHPYLVVADLTGSAAKARITSAIPISREEIETVLSDKIIEEDETRFLREVNALRRRRFRRIGALILDEAVLPVEANAANAELLAQAAADRGIDRLPWSKAQNQLRDRVGFVRQAGQDFPDLSEATLGNSAPEWLAPQLIGKSRLAEIDTEILGHALDIMLPFALRRALDEAAPMAFTAPTGNTHAIRYDGEGAPMLSIRVQELFGQTLHPAIARGKLPLTLELLSPAHRPIQITRDLPGFWAGSWRDVRAEMRGRYPRHVWPEDPANAQPTARAKPRGT